LKSSEQNQDPTPQAYEADPSGLQEADSTRLRISRPYLRLNTSKLVFLEQKATYRDEAGKPDT
jgi:hypothetical protein